MKRYFTIFLALIMAVTLIACSNQVKTESSVPAETNTKIEVTDLKGRNIVLDKVPERIVSLSPANTEILFALGAGNKVVGVTSYCNYPEEVKNIEKIGDFQGPNIELIKKVNPDLVLAGGYIQEDVIKALEDLNIPVVSTEAQDFNSIFDSIKLIGKVTGSDSKAEEILKNMNSAIEAVKEKVKDKQKPKVFYLVWAENLTTAGGGTFINDIIKIAGGINVAENIFGWTQYNAEQLIKDNPDIVISSKYATDSGVDKTTLENHDILKKLDAIKNGRLYIISNDDVVTRPGPRIIQAIEEFVQVLHGDINK